MTNYKEVFQLAQDKGCKFLKCKHCGNIELNCLKDNLCTSCFCYSETPTTQWAENKATDLLILTLIQKWLRDEHKIAVLIGRFAAGFYNYSIVPNINKSGEYQIIKRSSFSECWEQYESALLQGIHEALKLL